jgi:hypothetical protein
MYPSVLNIGFRGILKEKIIEINLGYYLYSWTTQKGILEWATKMEINGFRQNKLVFDKKLRILYRIE